MFRKPPLLRRYLQLRQINQKLNMLFVEQLTKDMLEEGGRDLGFLRKRALVFQTEDESSILMDYCIYNVLRGGRNLIQRLLLKSPPPEGSDEALVLQRMARAWYSLFVVKTVQRGLGVRGQDNFRQSQHLLIDTGLAKTSRPGMLLATRLIPFDDFVMTSGTLLPLASGTKRVEELIGETTKATFKENIRSPDQITPQQEKQLARKIISTALSCGASENVRYQDAGRS